MPCRVRVGVPPTRGPRGRTTDDGKRGQRELRLPVESHDGRRLARGDRAVPLSRSAMNYVQPDRPGFAARLRAGCRLRRLEG